MEKDSVLPHVLLHNPLPALVLDARNGAVLTYNPAAAQLFGCSLEEASMSRFLTSSSGAMAVYLEAVMYFGRYIETALDFVRADGTSLRVQVYGIHSGGSEIVLSFLDLNAQNRREYLAEQEAHHRAGLMQWQNIYGFFREVEAQNELILEAAGEGIYGINAEGKATFVNRAAQEMLGWNAEDLIGRELHSIIHHHHLDGAQFPAHECPIYDSFRRDKTVRVEDDAFWRKDGKPILVEYVSTPIYDHGVLAGAVVIFRDVTERKESEKKLRHALAEVETLRVQLEQENDYLLTEIRNVRSHAGIVGQSAAVRNLNVQIDLVADTKTNVLITGAAGTGKSLAVSALHEASSGRKRPLVHVNCSDITAQALEAEVFGYRRGAFRGAVRDTVGKLALANNGTLCLDEVSALPKSFQAKLMTVIKEGMFCRLGDTTDIRVDMTIISTTTRNLAAEVQAGRFRQDLFFELNVFSIQCDALRDRPDDIPLLAKHFLDRVSRRLRLPAARLSKANIETLLAYDWPGNVRELENVIERAAILAQGGKLQFEFQTGHGATVHASDRILSSADIRRIERENLIRCLVRSQGKVSGPQGAARLLELAPTTVYSKIKALSVSEDDWNLSASESRR
ncbi:sigma 54-interacting transcriptional regulator [Sulfitobacter guttiformis]|uniref:Nif-specific regulatory protein n=1 Tax=Sulfitobacter guttiformis TaxID=74349 RepID=A0A420DPB7_9RHOB|nr:sigma 54-interacting transcriptional regulator [Sulfitobacter guttiformis]KIN73338.1 Transcriptional regulatory protein [Sulfitobacter guttiformis KCTC 32187]RKE96007.1 PAS domain S-box-containing protein [Sulfitobacter guttiformis]